jgi:hypothetical protein
MYFDNKKQITLPDSSLDKFSNFTQFQINLCPEKHLTDYLFAICCILSLLPTEK